MTVDDDFVGQNGDFMLIKLNTGLSPYQSKFNFFISFFSKVHEILSQKQSSVLGACRCSWLQGFSKLLASFSTKNIHMVAKINLHWKMQAVGNPCNHRAPTSILNSRLFQTPNLMNFRQKLIKKLNFDWWWTSRLLNLKDIKSPFGSPAGQNDSNRLIVNT